MIKGYGSNEDSKDEEEYKRLKQELNWKTRQKLFAQGKLKQALYLKISLLIFKGRVTIMSPFHYVIIRETYYFNIY